MRDGSSWNDGGAGSMIATGIGSLPGTDMRGSVAAMAEIFDEQIGRAHV